MNNRDKLIVSCALIFAFLLNASLFLGPSPYIASGLAIFAILISLAWFLVAESFGMVIAGLTIFFILIAGFSRPNAFNPALNAGLFLILGIVLHNITNKIRHIENIVTIELDRIRGDRNILLIQHNRSQVLSRALYKKLNRYLALKEVIERLSPLLMMDEISQQIMDACWIFFDGSDAGLIYLLDGERQTLRLIKERLKDETLHIKAKEGDTFDAWVLKRTQPLLVTDAGRDFRFSKEYNGASIGGHSFKSLISAPLISQTKTVGILRLDSGVSNFYTADDLRLLNVVSDLAAVAISNSLLYQRTQQLAIIDGLTGLYLRRYFYQRLEEELKIAIEFSRGLSLAMIDIDNFKKYNDEFGHIAGDIVLKSLAKILKDSVKDKGFIAARYGGEEFAILVSGGSKEERILFAEGLRTRIEKESFYLRREEIKTTVSIGMCHYPDDAKRQADSLHIKKEDIIRIADERLYKAKAGGKNRVCG